MVDVLGAINLNLENFGIKDIKGLFYDLSYDDLFKHETDPSLTGYDWGIVSEFGAVAVDTGKFTGRSAKDKYIVEDDVSRDTVWWASGEPSGSDNKRLSQDVWDHLKELAVNQLNGKKLYVMDGFCGANPETRMSIRLVTEVAWMAHFFKNMFIRPTEEELKDFKPDWTILNACKVACSKFEELGLRSEAFVAFNLKEKMTVIGGTWYGGEIKKGIFSICICLDKSPRSINMASLSSKISFKFINPCLLSILEITFASLPVNILNFITSSLEFANERA